MVDAQRNVIINLKLAGDTKNQTIAREVAGQAQYAADAATAVYRSSMKQFEATEEGKSKIHGDETKNRVDKTLDAIDKQEKAHRGFTSRYQEMEAKRVEATQRANEAGVIAVQGLADMAEGAAKLGLVSEENFEKFARNFVMIQEGIRVFKGITDVWWKGREALIALSTATHAQTAANNLMAASNLRVAGSQVAGGALAGRAGGGVAGNIAGNAAAGVAGGAAVKGGSAFGGARVLGGMAIGAAKVGALAFAGADLIQFTREMLGDTSKNSEMLSDALFGWYQAVDNAEKSTNKLAKEEERRQRLLEGQSRYLNENSARLDFQGQLRSSNNLIGEAVGMASGESAIQKADRLRLEAIREVSAAERELAEDKARQDERVANGHLRSEQMTLRLLKEREEAQRRLYDADANRLAVIRSQNEAIEAQLKSERQRVAALKDAQKAETESLKERVGRMSPALLRKVDEISQRLNAGGSLSRRDVTVLESAGVGQKQVSQYYANMGGSYAGFNNINQALGMSNQAQIAAGGQNINTLQGQLAAGEGQAAIAGVSAVSSAELLKQTTEARIRQEAEMRNILEEQIKGMKANAQQVQQAAADSSDAIQQQGMATVNAIKDLGSSMLNSLNDIKKQIDETQLKQNGYKNP